MNEVSIFDFKENPIRVQTIDNFPWFCLADCCRVLELTNPSKVATQLSADGLTKSYAIDKLGREQPDTYFINEPNLYRLIFRSNKPTAQAFADWVYSDVLPTLRQTGSYVLETYPTAQPEYDINNIQVAEFELRAVKTICMLFGRAAGKAAYLASRLLPKPETISFADEANPGAAGCLAVLKSFTVFGQPLSQAIRDGLDLRRCGLEISGRELCLATSGREINAHFANTPWERNWVNTLLELPGCEKTGKVKRFGAITSRYITLPLFYLQENTHE